MGAITCNYQRRLQNLQDLPAIVLRKTAQVPSLMPPMPTLITFPTESAVLKSAGS